MQRLRVNNFFHWLGKTALRLTGWRVECSLSEFPSSVVIVAPHTSNWDFFYGLMASFELRVTAFWLGKHSVFRWPVAGLLRRLGGIPVDRRASHRMVEQVVEIFRTREDFILALAPEGTRRRTEKWKSGFYHIARGANVPIICAYLDYRRKVVGVGPIIHPTGDKQADMEKIRDFYRTITARYPEKATEARID